MLSTRPPSAIMAATRTRSTRMRKVALFEGMDEFGRLQPLLGTAEPATDYLGNPINWPSNDPNSIRPIRSSRWKALSPGTAPPPRTRPWARPKIWEIYNATGDAHPVHLHLVNFEVARPAGVHGRRRSRSRCCSTMAPSAAASGWRTSQLGAAVSTGPWVRRERAQGHGHRPARTGDPHQGHLRQARPLRLALPHPLPRGPRDDARAARRARRLGKQQPYHPILTPLPHGGRGVFLSPAGAGKKRAVPAMGDGSFCGQDRTRTCDLLLVREAL